ncbi:DNA topoisomerase 3 (plasmid) [Acinetobacter sp. ESL0695]|uniref:DNA topoisomerase 3 n=1 Tax=Acinetobacter sp. ESL0695 TaxID=2983215 RepID=UPI0023F05B97|nr:DNA topoisomerase 3 [Acinetobacter sp. ESL0695]WEV50255.1 DNA topoisomerase 3 [Acinetobacter sp. ESL0695]
MKRLFIAEKPELAKAIQNGLGGGTKKDGYFECNNGDLVTWCYGHMLRLADPHEYDMKYFKWELDHLPFCFIPWERHITADKEQQVKVIFSLIDKANVIVNAGDPDEEGQYLVDELLEFYGNKKPVYRVLINDNNLKVVQKALNNLRPNSEFAALSASAEARSVADQLYGYNLSRAYSLKAQSQGFDGTLSVGRVQTPMLGLIVRRCREFKSHQKSYYYLVSGVFDYSGTRFKGNYIVKDSDQVDDKKRLIDESLAESIAQDIKEQPAKIISYKTVKKETPPVLPYNLLKLQADASRKYGYKPDQVKEITQSLRERHSLITYNRSDCEYLSDEQHEDAPQVLNAILGSAPIFSKVISKAETKLKSRAFDSSKVSAHHAIIPTEATKDITSLSDAEKNIYLLIARAYIAQFFPNMKYDETTIVIQCSSHQFKTVSKVVTEKGWSSLYKNDTDNDELDSDFSQCDLRSLQNNLIGKCVESSNDKKETKPQPLYTMSSLLKDLTRIAKYIKDPHLKKILIEKDKGKEGEHGGIGTSATRDTIIALLLNKGFITEQGKSLVSTSIGEALYDALPDTAKYPDMTALWHEQQKDLKSKEDIIQFIKELNNYIANEVNRVKNSKLDIKYQHTCPDCKSGLKKIAIPGKDAFWGCVDKCGYTAPDSNGKPGVPKAKQKVSNVYFCKECKKGLIRRVVKKGKFSSAFWGCSGFPGCKEKYNDDKGKPVFK